MIYLILHISTCTRPIAPKHGKVVTHRAGLPIINSHNPLNKYSREVTCDKLKTYLHYTMLMVTRLIRVVTNRKELPSINSNTHRAGLPIINSHNPLNKYSREVTCDKLKTYLHYTMLMVTRLIRVVTNRKELPSINSNDASMSCSCEVP